MPDYIECPKHSPLFSKAKELGIFQLDTWGTTFHPKLDVQPEDKIIIKHRVSAFYNTDLETILHANNIETLIISGVATNNAVELTAREAHDRDYRIVIIEDACATMTDEAHRASLNSLQRISKIITASALVESNEL